MSFLRDQPHVPVPQTQRANDREVLNDAGGYVYAVDDWTRLDRFLTLGTAGGTFYVDQKTLTDDNARVVLGLLAIDGPRVVARVLEISQAGRAIKQDYSLFALALACASPNLETRSAAYNAVAGVCRTASTLLQFVSYLKGRRGWSRGLRSAIARWYGARDLAQLAYQLVKYPSRHGFTHRDLLRLAHADPQNGNDGPGTAEQTIARTALYRWAVGKDAGDTQLPSVIADADAVKAPGVVCDTERMAAFAKRLPREAVPTEWLTNPAVWEALLYGEDGRGMPLTAMIRNLGNLSKCGLLAAGSAATEHVCSELRNVDRLKAARIHPMALFLAGKTYAAGRGVRGSGTWAPVGAVVDALEDAFYLSFSNVETTGKHILVAIDSSGSMGASIAGYANVSARDASLAFALVVARTQPNARLLGFSDGSNTTEFKVSNGERLRDFVHRFNECVKPLGTDCAVPFTWAKSAGYRPDAILLWTDSQTWSGSIHPAQAITALRGYTRKRVKVAVAATTATRHSVGDTNDADLLQVCGFDAAVPAVIADFIRETPAFAA
jgi:60 kDa SS-A/Ro ribonucleoprotein